MSEEWRPRVNPWIIAPAVMLATFMEVLDTSIASVALPYIGGNLGATPTDATWVLTSYLVSNAIVLPASAWLSRAFGRKRLLITCIIIFSVSSFMCGAAVSLPMLIVARVVQGAGGGALQPLSQSIMLESFPPAQRGAAMAVYGIGVVCAPILGPTLGGWLTDTWSWRWAFYINIPISIVAVIMITLFVDDPPWIRNAKAGRIDSIGLGFMALGLSSLQILLDKGEELDWFGSALMRWMGGTAAFSLLFFVIWELSIKEPIVNLRVLANRNFGVACGLFFFFGAALYGLITMQPLFLQTLLGYTALTAGLTVTPRGVGAFISLFAVGALIAKVGGRRLAAWGFAVFALGAYMFSRLSLDMSQGSVVIPNIVSGIGTGLIFVPLTTVGMGTLRNDQIGNAAGIQNLLRNIGGSVGISVVTTMLERLSQAHQVFLVDRVSALSPIYRQETAALQGVLQTRFSPADAQVRAQTIISNLVHQQTSYWAFIELFWMFMWLGLACAVGVWLLKGVKSSGPVAAH
ncbi:MAG TPA: DHA2 family efflux MFS transporter permease subunit [Verrucomicrobiae bacterium]|jgi:DHA2 family multidrug resistance protein